MKACAAKAGCLTNYESMTDAQKQSLATKYNTSAENVGKAYGDIWNKTRADLKKGLAQHQARKAVMEADFKKSMKDFAINMGCDK